MPAQASRRDVDLRMQVAEDIGKLTLGVGAAAGPIPAPRYGTLVLATDGTPATGPAFAWTKSIAEHHGSRVLVTCIFRPPALDLGTVTAMGLYPGLPAFYEEQRESLAGSTQATRDELRREGIDADIILLEGSPIQGIANVARTHRAEMVILGSRSDMASPVGGVTDRLPDHVETSVLVARTAAPPRHILVATDGSVASRHAVAHALQLATDTGAALTIQHVLEHPEGARAPSALQLADAVDVMGLAASAHVAYRLDAGRPAEAILRRAADEHADLIVMGTRGRGLIKGFLLGSVSRRVVHGASASVLLVKALEDD